jgi:GcrA cell cycle regulator
MVNTGISIWSDALVELLKVQYARGRSAGQIAEIILAETGIRLSRNAVIGKIHRLKLGRRGENGDYNGNSRSAPAPKPVSRNDGPLIQRIRRGPPKIKPEPYVVAEPVDIAPRMLSVLELTNRTCKYGVGDVGEPGFGFCGHETAPGKPFCPAHCALAYRPPEKRERRPIYRESSTPRFGGRAA